MEILYSIVVPVYDTPPELVERCVKSVYGSRTASLELLLIDDGSENSRVCECIDSLAERYSFVRAYHLCHGGVSSARNYGIRLASGRYITCLDADDELVPGILDILEPFLRRRDPDLLLTEIRRDSPENPITEQFPVVRIREKEKLIRYYLTMNVCGLRNRTSWLNRAPHGRFVRRELALRVTFPENIMFGEDVVWNLMLLQNAGSVVYGRLPSYIYHENAFSATQKRRENYPAEVRTLFCAFRRLLAGYEEELDMAAAEYFAILMRVYVFAGDSRDRFRRYQKEADSGFWRDAFRRVKIGPLRGRYRLTALLMKLRFTRVVYMIYGIHHSR